MPLPSLTNNDLLAIEREYCSRSLSNFVKRAWPHIIPDTYQHNWHIDALCEHLEAVATGEIIRLLINVPPGTSKSTLTNVMFPAWLWGPAGRPEVKQIGAAHEQGLAIRDNRLMRELVTSNWYKSLWDIQLSGDQNQKLYFENNKRGFRQACAVGSMTGRRGDIITWDDPLNPEKAFSELHRETALRIFRETLPTRLNSPEKSAIIVIMQRLHDNDPSGYILANDLGYEHLLIPMEYEPSSAKTTGIGWDDPRTKEGELLDPVRFSQEVIDRDRKAMGGYAWAAQMQQRPAPMDGGIVKITWFQRYNERPVDSDQIVISWDTAVKDKQVNDPSVGTVWMIVGNKYYLVDIARVRQDFPALRRTIISLYDKWQPNAVLIEDKASGQSLLQDLRQNTKLPVIGINPTSDKVSRMAAETPTIEAGRVYLPERAPWLADFEAELMAFPKGAHDDQIDSLSQFLRWMREKQRRSAPQIRSL